MRSMRGGLIFRGIYKGMELPTSDIPRYKDTKVPTCWQGLSVRAATLTESGIPFARALDNHHA